MVENSSSRKQKRTIAKQTAPIAPQGESSSGATGEQTFTEVATEIPNPTLEPSLKTPTPLVEPTPTELERSPDSAPATDHQSLRGVAHAVIHTAFNRADRLRDAILESSQNPEKALDPEDIHQMRVSLRQLRSCLHIFQSNIRLEKAAQEPIVKSLAKALGNVRDLDILQGKLQEYYLPKLPDTEQQYLQKILRQLQRKHTRNLETLYDRLVSDRYRQFKKAYRTWLKSPQLVSNAEVDFCFLAPDILLPFLCQLLQHPGWFVGTIAAEGHYAPLPLADLCMTDLQQQETVVHDLRKSIKQLRYQLVLLSPFLNEGADLSLKAIVNALKEFQDILGNLQDLSVIRQLLQTFLHKKGLKPTSLQTCFQTLDQEYLELWQQWQPIQSHYLSPTFRFELRQYLAELSR